MRPRNATLLLDLVTGAVILSIAVALAGLTWRVVDLVDHRTPGSSTPPPAGPRSSINVDPIVTLAPFGLESGGDLRPTTLPIELRGIFLTIPGKASTALIAPTGGTAVAYRVGDALPAGASIATINRDSVVLAVSGHHESLGFPQQASAPGAATSAVAPVATASVTPKPSLAGPSGTGQPANPSQALLDSLGASPVSGGYRIGESLSSTAREAGLLPGDVINQVNGTLLGNPAMDRATLAMAARSGQLRIGLVRNGRQSTISLPLQ